MNIEDFDLDSLMKQKIPYPVISAITLDDKGGSISFDITWDWYEPLVAGKGLFDAYKSILTTNITLLTFDPNVWIDRKIAAGQIKKNGPFLEVLKKESFKELVSKDLSSNFYKIGNTFSCGITQPPTLSLDAREFRKWNFTHKFTQIFSMENPSLDKNGKIKDLPPPQIFALDRLKNLYGFIEITADFSNSPYKGVKGKLSYVFPFVVAQEQQVGFLYPALQTDKQEIWAAPFKQEGNKFFKTIGGEENSELMPVSISDPAVMSDLIGATTSDIFQLDYAAAGGFSYINDKGEEVFAENFKEAQLYTQNSAFKTLQKKIGEQSPLGELFFWDCLENKSVNLCFTFDITKFLNSDAFDYSGFGKVDNWYEGQINTISIIRKRITDDIANQKTIDFAEEKIYEISFQKGNTPPENTNNIFTITPIGQTPQQGQKESKVEAKTFDVSTDTNLKSLFFLKDKNINKNFKYQYGVEVRYTSRKMEQLTEYFLDASAKFQKFSSLENIIGLSRYYDKNFDRMTPAFKAEFKDMLENVQSSFQKLYAFITILTSGDDLQKAQAEKVQTSILNKITVEAIKPISFYIILDALRSSLEQIKNFSLAPNYDIDIVQNSSKSSSIATKKYYLTKMVSLIPEKKENYITDKLIYDFINQKELKSYTPLVLDKEQIMGLFNFEYAKYFGIFPSEDQTFNDDFSSGYTPRFTPLIASFGESRARFTNQQNFFAAPLKNQMSSIVYSINSGTPQVYKNKKESVSVSLDVLRQFGLFVVNSSNEETYNNISDLSKKTFADYLSDGNFTVDKSTLPENDVEQYQDLEGLSALYALKQILGQENYNKFFKDLSSLAKGETEDNNIPIPHYFLKRAGAIDNPSLIMANIKQKIINDEKLSTNEILAAILAFYNIFLIEYFDESEQKWQTVTLDWLDTIENNETLQQYYLCRMSDTGWNGYGFDNIMINNQYFLLKTSDIPNTISFVLPSKKKINIPKDVTKKIAPLNENISGVANKKVVTPDNSILPQPLAQPESFQVGIGLPSQPIQPSPLPKFAPPSPIQQFGGQSPIQLLGGQSQPSSFVGQVASVENQVDDMTTAAKEKSTVVSQQNIAISVFGGTLI